MKLGSCCRIIEDGVFLNGQKWMDLDGVEDKLTAVYHQLAPGYSKFYKMDKLSKASFLGVELLKTVEPAILSQADDEIGLLFSNSESSSDTDIQFRKSYQTDQLPSPSLFVYTLPNIAMGEIAIRNKWYGAHMFAVFPNFAPAYFTDYGAIMLAEDGELVIGGWVNVREKLDVMLFVLEKGSGEEGADLAENLRAIYHEKPRG
jgi:hypothetical protein